MNSDTKIIAGVISFAVIIIVIASVLVPVIEQSQSSVSHIESNTGYDVPMRELAPGETWTYQVSEDGTTATINGEVMDFSGFTTARYFFISDKFLLRVGSSDAPKGWLVVVDGTMANANLSNGASITIAKNGTATIVNGSSSATFDLSYSMVYDDTGAGKLALVTTGTKWVDLNTDVVGVWYINNTLSDGRVLSAIASFKPSGEVVDVNARVKSTDSVYTDVSDQVTITPKIAESDGVSARITSLQITMEGVEDVVNSSFMVLPIEYHRLQASDTAVHSIMSVIPIMCIIAVVVGAVQLIRTRE